MLNHYTIYTMPNCPHCVAAKELFKREGLNFTEITQFTPEELIAAVGPVRTLPQIIVENSERFHIGGYTDLLKYRAGEIPVLRKLG
jgi:glutaredoxin